MSVITNLQFPISNFFVGFLISLIFLIFPISLVEAQTSTESGKVLEKPIQVLGEQATDEGVLSNTVNQKLEDLKKEIASKAAALKNEVNKNIANKAVLGKATVISTDSITLETKNGNRTIKMNEYTLFQDISKQKSKKALTREALSSSDTLICLGDMDERGIMVAKKIVKTDPQVPSTKINHFGQISGVNNLSFILDLKQKALSGTRMVNFNGVTVVQNGKDDGNINDIKQGKNAVVIGKSKNETIDAEFVYILPVAVLKPTAAK